MLAISDNPIMTAQNSPKVEKNPILDWLITMNPAMSDTAEPKSARPEALPTAANERCGVAPFSRSSRYLSMRWMT